MVVFRPNPLFEREARRTVEMQVARRAAAAKIASHAQQEAPVATGDYRDSIHVETNGDDVQVIADDFKAGWIEFGTGGGKGHVPTPAYAPLRRGVEGAGYRLED